VRELEAEAALVRSELAARDAVVAELRGRLDEELDLLRREGDRLRRRDVYTDRGRGAGQEAATLATLDLDISTRDSSEALGKTDARLEASIFDDDDDEEDGLRIV